MDAKLQMYYIKEVARLEGQVEKLKAENNKLKRAADRVLEAAIMEPAPRGELDLAIFDIRTLLRELDGWGLPNLTDGDSQITIDNA